MRSESGRHDPVLDHEGSHVANITRASRKDVRDAVKAARKAQPGWAAKTAYNRGQVLYRAAEALESRAAEFDAGQAAEAVDVLVHYAGWTDKLAAVLGGVNPVAAPFLSFSMPEPTGVVGVVAPEEPGCSGSSARSRRRWPPATPSWRSARSASRCPAWTSARCSPCPTSRAAS